MKSKNKSNSLPTVEIEKDDEIITNEEINEWKWKSYHKVDVKQNIPIGEFNIINKLKLKIC